MTSVNSREAYVIDASGAIRARGDRSYRFWYEQPTEAQFRSADRDGIVLSEDWQNNEFRALVPLAPLADRYLYVTRDVDGKLLSLLDDTRQSVGEYQRSAHSIQGRFGRGSRSSCSGWWHWAICPKKHSCPQPTTPHCRMQ